MKKLMAYMWFGVFAAMYPSTAVVAADTDIAALEGGYAKKGDWRETLAAAKEAIWRAEGQKMADEVAAAGATLSFEVAGPFSNVNERHLLRPTLTATGISIRGKELPWRKLSGLKTHEVSDLARSAGLKANETAMVRVVGEQAASENRRARGSAVELSVSSEFGGSISREADLNRMRFRRDPDFCVPTPGGAATSTLSLKPGERGELYFPVRANEEGQCLVGICVRPRRYDPRGMNALGATALDQVKADFTDAASQMEMTLEFGEAVWPGLKPEWWFPGTGIAYSQARFVTGGRERLALLRTLKRKLDADLAARVETATAAIEALPVDDLELAKDRFRQVVLAELLVKADLPFETAQLAVEDQINLFGKDRYPNGASNLETVKRLRGKANQALAAFLAGPGSVDLGKALQKAIRDEEACAKILLENPALGERLVMLRGKIQPSNNWRSADQYGNEIVTLSPVARDGEIGSLFTHAAPINSIELNWDADKLLVCDNSTIFEIGAQVAGEPEVITPENHAGAVHDACRLPNGRIIYSSTSVEQAVPCTGGGGVGNLHIMDGDGENVRRLCYDQDHNWHPTVMENGRVMFLRWEYTGQVHYFSRIVMTMNPDGTDQVAHYGSDSYWPNSAFYPRQIPGISSQFAAIVSGHHGVAKRGELTLFDVAKGRFEADGAIQKIGARGVAVEPIIADRLVDNSYPHFLTPFPLGTGPKDGAGKYFLATGMMTPEDGWGLYLVDVFDNMTLIKKGDYSWARPIARSRKPPIIPDRVNLTKKTATVVISNIHHGPGLAGIKPGSVKRLRVAMPVYRYPGNGDTYASAAEGGWDIKRILGTVPVDEDGSVSFECPANAPIFVQPLNAEGQALQLMRSWFTPMPGASVACIGCHESQNDAPPSSPSSAMRRAPSKIEGFYGPARGFGFEQEIQPMLERKCVGCHDGSKKETLSGSPMPDFRRGGKGLEYRGTLRYSRSYMDLQRYVRRAGVEPDAHLFRPTEWMADTSHLIKMLKKGHHNVVLTAEEWARLYTWIDLNVPYPARWRDSVKPPKDAQVEVRNKYLAIYAGIDERIEQETPLPPPESFQRPGKAAARKSSPKLTGWPLAEEAAKALQANAPLKPLQLTLGESTLLDLMPIPSGSYVTGDGSRFADEPAEVVKIEKPFLMGATEVTFAQYSLFDPDHENGFIEGRGKDRKTRGLLDMSSKPDYPAVRITQERANAFCEWLTDAMHTSGQLPTTMEVALPTEEQWEWAARAGKAGVDILPPEQSARGYNIIDAKGGKGDRLGFGWNYGRIQRHHDDGAAWVDSATKFTPNGWGLYNMVGNVAEWTRSNYVPLKEIGVTKEAANQIQYKVVRGGSWNDTAAFANLASRWRYTDDQPVMDVGFRVIITAK